MSKLSLLLRVIVARICSQDQVDPTAFLKVSVRRLQGWDRLNSISRAVGCLIIVLLVAEDKVSLSDIVIYLLGWWSLNTFEYFFIASCKVG